IPSAEIHQVESAICLRTGGASHVSSLVANRYGLEKLAKNLYNSLVMPEVIRVTGAREHNLKDITVEIPRDKLVVITGLSGSGKSSLAFDTIYAEGQRRYV